MGAGNIRGSLEARALWFPLVCVDENEPLCEKPLPGRKVLDLNEKKNVLQVQCSTVFYFFEVRFPPLEGLLS